MKTIFTLPFILAGILMAAGAMRTAAAPANDLFANRTALTGPNVVLQDSNTGAGTEPGEYTGNVNILYLSSVWYEWTAPTNGILYVSGNTTVPAFFMSVNCYRGSDVSALAAAATTPDGGIPVAPGDRIEIKVATFRYTYTGSGGGTGPFSLSLSLSIPVHASANDTFASRFAITSPTYHFSGSIYQAASETGEPLPPGSTQTLWWSFTPPGNGNLSVTVSAAQFAPAVRVYDGNTFATMQAVSPVSGSLYPLQAGHVYSVQIASGSVPGGNFSLDTQFYSRNNDMFATADLLTGTNITYTGNFTTATMEPGEPNNGAANTIWAAWAAPDDGYVQVSKATAPYFQIYAIYTGQKVDQLQPVNLVGNGYNSIFRFLVSKGEVYHFQFSGGADNITFYIEFHNYTPPTNDYFTNATVVKGYGANYPLGSVLGATTELGEPQHMGSQPARSIWWQWQAPVWGTYYLNPAACLVTNIVLAVYSGNSVEALTLLGKATNALLGVPVIGGQTYYVAGVVPTNAVGDIMVLGNESAKDTSAHYIPGNVLLEPSWEGTALNPVHWGKTPGVGGYVNENGGADGTTWPALGTYSGGHASIWQDFATTPGHQYAVRFAYQIGGQLSGGSGDAQVGVLWNGNRLGTSVLPGTESGFWHWDTYTALASNANTRITFTNLARNVEMDAFSAVDVSAGPAIVNQPVSISSVAGGTAAFIVGATGTPPLAYQWFFNDTPLDGQTNKLLTLDSLTVAQAGEYRVTITNNFGAVTSSIASLLVDNPDNATILSQPWGDTVCAGGYYNFTVVAAGTPPLAYQWYLNSQVIVGATNRNLMLTNVQPADAGEYLVKVANHTSVAWSLPATLVVTVTNLGGGVVDFRNRNFLSGATNANAPVFDADGTTLLKGSNYLAQLYAGPALDQLRPAGQPTPFQDGFDAGYFVPQMIALGNVAPGSNAVMQVCAWDAQYGTSYEQARALGGRFGKSAVLQAPVGGRSLPPGTLQGLQSFNLQTGLPYFEVGTIAFVQKLPPDTMVWSLTGQAGSVYLIEKSKRSEETVWRPFLILTNATGTVNFTDTASSGAANAWYRARILD